MKAILILAIVGAPAVVAAAPPAWCGTSGGDKPHYDVKTLFTTTDAAIALEQIVGASCYPEEDVANLGAQITSARAAWSKKLGLTEDEWVDVSAWAHLSNGMRGDTVVTVRDRAAAWSAYSPFDQLAILQKGSIGTVDAAYVADAFGAKLGQLGMLGYVGQCLDKSSRDPAVDWAMCAPDAAALDRDKIVAEIRADATHDSKDRISARLVAYDVLTVQLPKLRADMAAYAARDPAYATVFATGPAARAAFAKADPQLVAFAAQIDDARITGSRRASTGCTEKAWDGWKKVVAHLGAKRLATIHTAVDPGRDFINQLLGMLIAEPDGYLAALALTECAKLEGKEDGLSGMIATALARWPGVRGPRTGTQTAILVANVTLDDRNAKLEPPDVDRSWIFGNGNIGVVGGGGVAKVEGAGDRTTIAFAKEKVTQQRCVRGHETSKISSVSNGYVHYYYQCDKEITETIEVPPSPPLKVIARYAAGIKPGMTVQIENDVAVVAYPKGSGTPAIVTGVEVK